MQKPLQIPGHWAKWFMRIMVGGFITLVAVFIIGFVIVYRREHTASVANRELSGAVTEISQPDHHETKWYVAKLSDGQSIVLENAMLGVLKVGDSLFKKKGEGFYIMKQRNGNEMKIRMFQP